MKKHILIVHRNAETLRELRALFARAGYPVMTAVDWETARRLSARFSTDLILCEPDGHALATGINENRESSRH